jgi:hypothetical protein
MVISSVIVILLEILFVIVRIARATNVFMLSNNETLTLNIPSKMSRPSVSQESIYSNLNLQLLAGTSSYGFSGDNGPATSAQINAHIPWVDSNGNIYIPVGTRIRKVDSTTGIITTFGGTGSASTVGTSGPISSTPFQFSHCIVGAGSVFYFSDETYVWKYSFSTNMISVYAGSKTVINGFSGDNGVASTAALSSPLGLWLTTSGVLYIADSGNYRIRRVSSSGIITTVAGSGCTSSTPTCVSSFSGDNGPATSATLKFPRGLFMDSVGKLFIADLYCYRIRMVNTNDIIATFAGTGTPSPFNGNNIRATAANIDNPFDVKGDSLGNIFIADHDNSIIRIVDSSSGIISTLFGSLGSLGFSGGITPQSESLFMGPFGMWVDSLGSIYISDFNSIHRSVSASSPTSQPSGRPTRLPTVQPIGHPTAQPRSQPSNHPSGQPTIQPSLQPFSRPSSLPSSIPSRQPSTRPTSRPSSVPSSQPSIQPSSQPTGAPGGQPTFQPSTEPTSRPSHQPTQTPTRQPSSLPSSQPSNQPTSTPTRQPSISPTCFPSVSPTDQPTSEPTKQPSCRPTVQPISIPTNHPSESPSVQPTSFPSSSPTRVPSSLPSSVPSIFPSSAPSPFPSSQPTSNPSNQPSNCPSSNPSSTPSTPPSNQPSSFPTSQPLESPSSQPTVTPIAHPTVQPTSRPSDHPTIIPSRQPFSSPTSRPSFSPSNRPTTQPSAQPTRQPTRSPSSQPSRKPASNPSLTPSAQPTAIPSRQPSEQPSSPPTHRPSCQPSTSPTRLPTAVPPPTCRPSGQPVSHPTSRPSSQPSHSPSRQPRSAPTSRPSEQPTMVPTAQPFTRPTSAPAVTIYQTNGILFGRGSISSAATAVSNNNNNKQQQQPQPDNGILGTSYILFGRNFNHQRPFPSTISLGATTSREFVSEMNKNGGFGIHNDVTTRSITVIGDINGDGFPDLLVGYPTVSKCSVYLGQSNILF